jgi:metallo-beta-lactamase family protein
MKITFTGAARTVTGSRHLLEVGGRRILLDCGLYQGRDEEMEQKNHAFPFDVRTVDAVVLSHAHNDHVGNIPNLVKHGFRGPVLATPPTVDLSKHIMLDSAKIQESDARYENKHRGEHEPRAEPLFTERDAEEAWKHFEGRPGGSFFEVVPGIRARFEPAGHILGAAVVLLELEEKGRRVRLGFSGDLGRFDVPLLKDPSQLAHLDYLLLESTYGDRDHQSIEAAYAQLRDIARRCCDGPGKLLIPSFALGRAQDLIYHFHRMMDAGEIDPLPIYVDSPLAVRLTQVFRKHQEAYDTEAHAFMADDTHKSPLDFPQVHYISEVADSIALNDMHGPMIIISSSGMLTGGRIRHHLRHTITDPRNTVLLVSWQAPGTLGRKLVEKADTVRLFGQDLPVRAAVHVINGFSAHADRTGLTNFGAAAGPGLKGTFLVHGEPGPAFGLAELLHGRGLEQVAVPELGDTFEL